MHVLDGMTMTLSIYDIYGVCIEFLIITTIKLLGLRQKGFQGCL